MKSSPETTKLFWHLVHNADSEQWNEDILLQLPVKYLQAFALLWGAPKSGSREKIVIRILAVRHIRLKIARFGSDHAAALAFAAEYLKCDLKQMCLEAGQWRSGNKIQLAATLLSWRNRSRTNGQKVLDQIKKAVSTKPVQLSLPL